MICLADSLFGVILWFQQWTLDYSYNNMLSILLFQLKSLFFIQTEPSLASAQSLLCLTMIILRVEVRISSVLDWIACGLAK